MTFFDHLKPDRPEFDEIEQDTSKIIVFDHAPAGMEDFIFPPAPPYATRRGTKVTSLSAGANLVEDILLDSERRADERKASWWKRLWSR